MTFMRPAMAVIAAACIVCGACALLCARRLDARGALSVSSLDLLIAAYVTPDLGLCAGIARVAAASLLLFAAAGPRIAGSRSAPPHTLVFCIDTSGSMRRTDYAPNRLEAIRNALHRFAGAHSGQAIGLVSFSGKANVLAYPQPHPLHAIARLPAPNGQTNIGAAIRAAASLISSDGAIILITDGINNKGGRPEEALGLLGARGVPLHAVVLGNDKTIARKGQAWAHVSHGLFFTPRGAEEIAPAFESAARFELRETKRFDLTPLAAVAGLLALALAGVAQFAAGQICARIEPGSDARLRPRHDAPHLRPSA